MIKILDSNLKRLAILQNIETCTRFEEINGENKLDFTGVYEGKIAQYVDETAIVELDNDYFDIAYYTKDQADNGTLAMQVQSEHVSYRLNNTEYNLDLFAATGTPEEVLTQILDGTPFSVGTVEYTDNVTYSAQEAKSRRQLLMELVALVGGEVNFDKFVVSLVQHRGSTSRKLLAKGKNVKVVSKIYDGRQKDVDGNPLVSYTCTPIQLPDTPLNLGDEVLLIQKDLGIREPLRIVSFGENPYNPLEASIVLANFVSGIEDTFYSIATTKVTADKSYYGAKIGPENGFESIRSDKKARAFFNADAFKMQSGDGTGDNWTDKLYFDPENGEYTFDGQVIVKSLGVLLAQIYRDTYGGQMKIYDSNGKLNVSVGVESGAGDNIGGTIIIFEDAPDGEADAYRRIEFGINKQYHAGLMNLRDAEGRVRSGLYADISGIGGAVFVVNALGEVVSYLNETSGQINTKEIATQDWVTDQIAAHVAAYHT